MLIARHPIPIGKPVLRHVWLARLIWTVRQNFREHVNCNVVAVNLGYLKLEKQTGFMALTTYEGNIP